MTELMIVALFGLLLVLFGALLGAEVQDKLQEGRRRRTAYIQRQVNARWRAMEDRGSAFELPWPGSQLVIPVAVGEDSD